MFVRHLSLVDYRSYPSAEIPLGPGVTVFLGDNGQGKTNLVEAVNYVATLGSHRVASDAPLVRRGASRAVVRTAIVHDERQLLVELEINPGQPNRARLNRNPLHRAREVIGVLRAVLFAPEDLATVRGDPAERRRFLDDLLVARTPRYAGVRADYDRVLRQRNALLKSAGGGRRSVDPTTLDVWDGHLAQVGAKLLVGRLALVAALTPHIEDCYAIVADDGRVAASGYASTVGAAGSVGRPATGGMAEPPGSLGVVDESGKPGNGGLEELADAIRSALLEVRPRELERGVTLVGPHRDDMTLSIGELPARGYASHGESWSLALALKLAAYRLLRSDGGEPVLILDDVFAELDAARREKLAGLVAAASQVLVTAAVGDDVPAALRGACFQVAAGQVSRV